VGRAQASAQIDAIGISSPTRRIGAHFLDVRLALLRECSLADARRTGMATAPSGDVE
jgi:hypothetical protein